MATKVLKRKLAAIFSADVKGYSRMMGMDEGSTVITLTTYRKEISSLINKHRGRVVDSPGDNLLAEFASVVDAVQCAVKIQERLKTKNKELPRDHRMEFRIGINLGDVIEKRKRIYGDGVNIAARIEGLAEAGGISISSTAYDQVKNKLGLEFGYMGEHNVKNIAEPVRVYKVLMQPGAATPMLPAQKIEVLLYTAVTLGALYFLYFKYLRYIIADFKFMALLPINFISLINIHPIVSIAIGVLFMAVILLLMKFKKKAPQLFFKMLKGGFGFCAGFLLFYLPAAYLPFDAGAGLRRTVYQSENLFVEVVENNVHIYKEPNSDSPILRKVNKGNLLLLADVSKKGSLTWNKVLLGKKEYGWIMRVVPPKFGASEKRLTFTYKFNFRYTDIGAFLIGIFGFVWGFIKFRIRTT
ncbi:MAG: adenylate/guanylate cyclase domain-containing protein [Thermodesulfobacteriota bacterium]|nr:adenylate/guanylate cyclase domain-containing protein [Thermodesulfobacteriota bacterium]